MCRSLEEFGVDAVMVNLSGIEYMLMVMSRLLR